MGRFSAEIPVPRIDFRTEVLTVTVVSFVRLARVVSVLVSPLTSRSRAFAAAAAAWLCVGGSAAEVKPAALASFHAKVEPILEKYCYDCHGNGLSKGKVSFDEFASPAEMLARKDLWWAALKNVQGGLMPPREEGDEKSRPTAAEIETLTSWIKLEAFGVDPANPDPGRVTARRLNRIEYRNTIRDLMAYDFNSEVEFPPDDSGNGFDNNGDVLTISPLLLEKYLAAAETIVDKAVPKVSRIIRERTATGRDFRGEGGSNGERLNARNAAKVSRTFNVDKADRYRVAIEFEVRGSFDFDPSHCELVCTVDGVEKHTEKVVWSESRRVQRDFEFDWKPGNHVVAFEVKPLPPVDGVLPPPAPVRPAAEGGRRPEAPRPSATSVTARIVSVQVRGPLSPAHWVAPENHDRFFPRGPAPAEASARDAYAEEILRTFATRAYRRPLEAERLAQLVALAKSAYAGGGKTFEEGIGRAMMAVLASPRFLFRVELPEPKFAREPIAPIDEYALASRLSYLLWSSTPDDELLRLAGAGELRRNLRAQVERLLKDAKSQAFIRNFTGQWLQARDIEFVPINPRAVMGNAMPRNREGRQEFDGPFRRLMRSETEMYFEYVMREDRSVLELIDSDYTFLNEKLASFYGIPVEVKGEQMQRVTLPPGSPRGGLLTQGTILAVTSNPTRTSPVKRGLFILENILGTPPPPAPPNVPDLEEARKDFKGREPKLSEMLAVHRANALCSSCHERMDPLGLAFENFNALGAWRDRDAGQPIEAAGQLVTGEKFADVRELKRVIARDRKHDVYHCLAEKLLTYALGRGLEYYDTFALDEIIRRLERDDGKFSALLMGVVESVPFQKQRTVPPARGVAAVAP
ncbi:MAG: hypothetical protein B9S34_06875 [Opitutia bacterium Tous-C1TDCM]|nr:MAG: hypothetical protein B9S34_06875 [Opitutae bacterium Tous-C1TDCM]